MEASLRCLARRGSAPGRQAALAQRQQRRLRGSTHTHLNWHSLDYLNESYHSLQSTSMYYEQSKLYNHEHTATKWDLALSPHMYAARPAKPILGNAMAIPQWINEHLFARTYWNTNLNLYYWKHFHLNFYFIERKRIQYKSVFTNQYVLTPRWAYNLVLLYTKNPAWDYVDIGLRTKTLLYVNSHIWLVFKFKMHKVARLNGIEKGIQVKHFDKLEHTHDPDTQKMRNIWKNNMRSVENLNHYQMDETPSDHTGEGAGAAHTRNYAHVGTMTGPEFSREHTQKRPWWWHSHPHKRKRWDASNPFGHDLNQLPTGTASPSIVADMDKRLMTSW